MDIKWEYFFGASGKRSFDRYYKSEISGIRVEKHLQRSGTEYSIGNMDKAKNKYKSEEKLINAVKKIKSKSKYTITPK